MKKIIKQFLNWGIMCICLSLSYLFFEFGCFGFEKINNERIIAYEGYIDQSLPYNDLINRTLKNDTICYSELRDQMNQSLKGASIAYSILLCNKYNNESANHDVQNVLVNIISEIDSINGSHAIGFNNMLNQYNEGND